MLVLLLVRQAFVSTDVDLPSGADSHPRWVDEVVQESILRCALEDGISILNGVDSVDPDEVVVVPVLVSEQLKLRVEAVGRCQRILAQVIIRELHSLLQGEKREVEGRQKQVYFTGVFAVRIANLVADLDLNRE